MKIPGVNTSVAPQKTASPLGTLRGPDPGNALAEPYIADATTAAPSILWIGDSGTGKTHAIERLLRAGKKVLYLDVEGKSQPLKKYKPIVQSINDPVRMEDGTLRAATFTEKYNRLQEFVKRLGAGYYHKLHGIDIDLVAVDGLMEIGHVYSRHFSRNTPVSADGSPNAYAKWGQIGDYQIDFYHALRNAASDAGLTYGLRPLGVVATCGEKLVADKFGNRWYEPILPGNIGPDQLPFAFEAIIRLGIEYTEEGPTFLAYTVGQTEPIRWFAKTPPGLFEPKVINPDAAKMYDTLVTYYTAEVPAKEVE